MKKELDEKLVKDFPLLYRQRHLPMNQTCMCWGFPGDGWEPLIRELSEKLEPLVREIKKKSENCFCGCHVTEHNIDDSYKCTKVFKIPFSIRGYNSYIVPKSKIKEKFLKSRWLTVKTINSFLEWISPIIYKSIKCNCEGYNPRHPSASQVKEKYATLRFYMDTGTDEMYKLIHEYEEKSETICENCGNSSKIREDGYWLLNMCDKCWEEHKKEGK